MIARLLSKIGFGTSKVDLVLEKSEYHPGDMVTGSFHMKAGMGKQTIKRLECDLMRKEPGKKPVWLQPVTTILTTRSMDSHAQTEYPFHFQLPEDMDPSSEDVTYQLKTKLVFDNNVKKLDTDEIRIHPDFL